MKNNQKLLKINQFLSKTSTIVCLMIVWDLFLLGILNVLVNIVLMLLGIVSEKTFIFSIPYHEILNPKTKFLLYLYVIFMMILIFFNITTGVRMKLAFSQKYINVGQKGQRRITTDQELEEQYKKIDLRETPYPGLPGTIVARRGDFLYIDDSAVNNLYVGSTRSGKDETVCAPNNEVYSRAEIQPSIIQFDPKSEGYKYSKKELTKRGYRVYLLNLIDPLHSMQFNPLSESIDLYKKGFFGEFELMVRSFAYAYYNPDRSSGENKYFDSNAVHLLTALCIAFTADNIKADKELNENRLKTYKKKQKKFAQLSQSEKEIYREKFNIQKTKTEDFITNPTIKYIPDDEPFFSVEENEKKINLYSIIVKALELANQPIPNSYNTMLDDFFLRRPVGDRAKLKYFSINLAGEKTKGGIYSTMLDKILCFTYENVAKMTLKSSFKLEEIGFGEKPIAVFINAPEYDASLHLLASFFINQVYFINSKKAGDSGACKRPIKFVANEIGNFPAIPGLKAMVTVGLAKKISFDFHVQDLPQLEQVYGKDAKSIISNCGNKFYLLSDDEDTIKFFSFLLGNETYIDVQRTGEQFSLKKSFMESPQDKPLMRPEELTLLKPGESILVRTIKRIDLKGNPIDSMPIFNLWKDGNQMYFRYEYLEDIFPSPKNIFLSDINELSNEQFILTDYLMENNVSIPIIPNNLIDNTLTLEEIDEWAIISIESLLKERLGENFREILNITDTMTLDNFARNINENSTLSNIEKDSINFVLSSFS